MNKLETAYSDYLASLVAVRQLAWFRFEAIKLKLADRTTYTPDFLCMAMDGTLECHDCKGWIEDDFMVKIKVAADQFPFRFFIVKRTKKEWNITEV